MLATRDVTPLHGNIINLHGPQALDYTTLRSLVEAQLRSQGIPIPLVTPSPPKGNTLLSMTPIDNKSLMNMMNASQSEDELLMKYYGYLALAGKVSNINNLRAFFESLDSLINEFCPIYRERFHQLMPKLSKNSQKSLQKLFRNIWKKILTNTIKIVPKHES